MKPFIYILLTVICVFGITACSRGFDFNEVKGEVSQKQLREINSKSISVDTNKVVMQSDTIGTVEITIQIPDYKVLYKNVFATENPEEYLLATLQSGKYDICEHTIVAAITIKNGDKILHTDEAVKELLEQELSNAIGALMEE